MKKILQPIAIALLSLGAIAVAPVRANEILETFDDGLANWTGITPSILDEILVDPDGDGDRALSVLGLLDAPDEVSRIFLFPTGEYQIVADVTTARGTLADFFESLSLLGADVEDEVDVEPHPSGVGEVLFADFDTSFDLEFNLRDPFILIETYQFALSAIGDIFIDNLSIAPFGSMPVESVEQMDDGQSFSMEILANREPEIVANREAAGVPEPGAIAGFLLLGVFGIRFHKRQVRAS